MFFAFLFYLVQPNEEAVPLSIPVSQMNLTDYDKCEPPISDGDDCNNENTCGRRCWGSNSRFYYAFEGVRFAIYGTKDSSLHKFFVELDGNVVKEVDEYSTTRTTHIQLSNPIF